jgi:hypothetical protein
LRLVRRYINNLEVQMANVAKHTSGLMKRNRDLANGLFEFGLSFTLLAQTETDQLAGAPPLARALTHSLSFSSFSVVSSFRLFAGDCRRGGAGAPLGDRGTTV